MCMCEGAIDHRGKSSGSEDLRNQWGLLLTLHPTRLLAYHAIASSPGNEGTHLHLFTQVQQGQAEDGRCAGDHQVHVQGVLVGGGNMWEVME